MRQFQVPQFITVEDQVIGPLTIKQFLYVGGGAFIIIISYKFFAGFLFYLIALVTAALAGGFAFVKINERPFPIIFKSAVLYFIRPRLYIWKKEPPSLKKRENRASGKSDELIKGIPKMSESKLSDLAWSLDIKEKAQESRRE